MWSLGFSVLRPSLGLVGGVGVSPVGARPRPPAAGWGHTPVRGCESIPGLASGPGGGFSCRDAPSPSLEASACGQGVGGGLLCGLGGSLSGLQEPLPQCPMASRHSCSPPFCLHPAVLRPGGHQSCWTRTHREDLIRTWPSAKAPFPR